MPCVSESRRQQLGHNTLHLSGDTKLPLCPLVPYSRGWPRCQDPLLLESSSFPVHRGRAPPLLKREERQVRARVQELSCGFVVCVGRPIPFSALQWGFAGCLATCADLSLQALQNCKKSNKPVSKYDHTYLILDIQVSELLEVLSYTQALKNCINIIIEFNWVYRI